MAILEVKNLKKRFGSTDVLKGVSFSLEQGQVLAIIGSSGSGKTTLLRCLNFLETPDAGEIRVGGKLLTGENLTEAQIRENRLNFGLVFQNFNLLPKLNAVQNVELPLAYAGVEAAERRERAVRALQRVKLADRMYHKPSELSGGQRQRVAIARALVTNPGILLADEPTGALDSKTGIEIMKLFDELHQEGNTIILITHEQEIANYAIRNVYIKDGSIHYDRINTNRTIVS